MPNQEADRRQPASDPVAEAKEVARIVGLSIDDPLAEHTIGTEALDRWQKVTIEFAAEVERLRDLVRDDANVREANRKFRNRALDAEAKLAVVREALEFMLRAYDYVVGDLGRYGRQTDWDELHLTVSEESSIRCVRDARKSLADSPPSRLPE